MCRRSGLHACLEDADEIFTECCVCVAGPYSIFIKHGAAGTIGSEPVG